ncbi:recombinase family protein [Brevundimonas sp. DWR2-3-1b1]|uniref:recombinase family protein n=1 Tax=unclassified Brevundimonas TaxID=2622653 RepID=UPI003CED2B6B
MALVGYARASSISQDTQIQIEALKAAGVEDDHLFVEKRSGATTEGRDELAACLKHARRGDTVLVTKLDRLGRSVNDLSRIVADLESRAIGFRVLDQHGIDTTTTTGKLLFNMLSAFAEFETALRAERQRAGIEKAKAEGRYTGRPAKIDPIEIARLRAEGLGATEIARRLRVGRASVYRVMGGLEAAR